MKTGTLGRAFVGLAFSAAVTLSLPATAQAQSASDKAAAEALFDDGVRLLKAGNYEEACMKLERSQQVEPGIGTLLYLGECYKKVGRTASAWATFREAASKAKATGEKDRARAGKKKADELEAKLSRVSFEMASENMQIEGLQVTQGGSPVNRALWGTAVPVDPGDLMVTVKAAGYESFEVKMEVKEGPAEATLSIPALVPLAGEAPAEDLEQTPAAESAPEDGGAQVGKGQRTTGLVLGGVGVAGVVVGGVFGGLAIGKSNSADEFCDGAFCEPGSEGVSLTDDARTFATVSTIGFIAGGALLATGAVLYFTAPSGASSARVKVSPTVGGAHVSLGGTF